MSQTILASILSPRGLRVVDETTGFQIWNSLAVVSVEIESIADNADIPFAVGELGDIAIVNSTTEADLKSGKVLMPTRITISSFVSDATLIASLLSVYQDVTHSLTVTSRSIISKNMVVTNMTIVQEHENTSSNKVEITMEQAAPPGDEPATPLQAADANTYGVTVQEPASLTSTVADLYNKLWPTIGV